MGHEERFPPTRLSAGYGFRKGDDRRNAPQRARRAEDRDRGTPRGANPSHTTGHTGPYHGGSIGLSVGRNAGAGKTETVEIRVAQSLLDGRMSGHAPETGRRAGSNRRVEL